MPWPCPSIATRLANDSRSKNGFKQKSNYRFVHQGHYLLAFSTSKATLGKRLILISNRNNICGSVLFPTAITLFDHVFWPVTEVFNTSLDAKKEICSDLYCLKCISSFKNKIKQRKEYLKKKCKMLGKIKRQKLEGGQKWIRYKIKSPAAIPGSKRKLLTFSFSLVCF